MISRSRALLALPCLAILAALVAAAEPPRAKPGPESTGQLKIEGQAIERVTLERKEVRNPYDPKNSIILDHPGPSVSVPAGEYWVREVDLKGGYLCPQTRLIVDVRTGEFRQGESLTINSGKPCSLKIGGPLKSTVLGIREGRIVRFIYRLLDANGRMYVRRNAASAPRFTVSCDGRVVASGSFEYG